METQKNEMLDLLPYPGFCVRAGTVVQANAAAMQLQICAGTALAPLLHTGREEYAEFSGGCLYLTLNLNGAVFSASVHRIGQEDLFLLEPEESPELQAYALAAQSLRGPLSTLMAAVHLSPDSSREQSAQINQSLFQLLRLVSNMSDAGRCSTGCASHAELRDIGAVMEDLFSHLAVLCQKAGVEVIFSNLHESICCLVDTEKLERGVYNIISNALKFTPRGGTIRASLIHRGRRLYLSVQDSGSGIPDEQKSSVFRRFLRQPGIEDGRHGIGLGMVLICAAATAHGGTVLMETPAEGGTRMTMTLEIRQKPPALVRSPRLQVDYAGEWNHSLMELSEVLPNELYGSGSDFL